MKKTTLALTLMTLCLPTVASSLIDDLDGVTLLAQEIPIIQQTSYKDLLITLLQESNDIKNIAQIDVQAPLTQVLKKLRNDANIFIFKTLNTNSSQFNFRNNNNKYSFLGELDQSLSIYETNFSEKFDFILCKAQDSLDSSRAHLKSIKALSSEGARLMIILEDFNYQKSQIKELVENNEIKDATFYPSNSVFPHMPRTCWVTCSF